MVGDLRLKIEASTSGKRYRSVAIGIRHPDGSVGFSLVSKGEAPPPELLDALHRYLEEFRPSVGTWNHKIGDTDYRVSFTNLNSTTATQT